MKSINIKSIIAFALLVVAIGFTSCKSGNKTETKETTKVEETHSETIEVSEEQMKAVGIELGTIEMKNLNSVVKSSGQLEVPPQNKADVNSLVSGIIKKNISVGRQLCSPGANSSNIRKHRHCEVAAGLPHAEKRICLF